MMTMKAYRLTPGDQTRKPVGATVIVPGEGCKATLESEPLRYPPCTCARCRSTR